jgi:vitamin B12 transporter
MRKLLSTTALALIGLTSAAFAEDDDIVVTGVRTPTPIETLPARIDVIDRADIERQNLISLADAIGAQAVQAGGAGQQASLFLRGANSKHALALFDGMRINDASTPNAQYDFGLDTLGGIERVEVLRGPASSIYGSDAIGGVVNLIPRRGGETAFEPFFEASAGSFETRRVVAGAAGGIGAFEYGVSTELFDTEGHDLVPARFTTATGDADGATQRAFTLSARNDAGVFAFDALVRLRRADSEFDTFSGGAFFDLRADDPDLKGSNDQALWRLGAEMEAGTALTFRLEGGEVRIEREEVDGGVVANAAESTQRFLDLSARYARDGVTLVAGAELRRDEIDTLPQFAAPLQVEEEQSAFYLNGQTRFAERFTATGSVRVDDTETFGAQTTYALGLVADLGALRAFASYGTAFKAPSLSERFELSLFNIGNPDLLAEESRSWELGADWAVFEGFSVGGSYYQTRIDDLIDYNFGTLQNVNVGEAAIDGAEAYVEAAPTRWAALRLAYAWTDARNEITGAPLARRPEHSWRAEARITPTDRLGLSLVWDFVGERTDVTYSNGGVFLSGNAPVESYNVGALAATYDLDDHAELFARVDNLTDESYEQPSAFAAAGRGARLGVRARF